MKIIDCVNANTFGRLFIEELGWSLPRSLARNFASTFLNRNTGLEETHVAWPIAEYRGLSVWEYKSVPSAYIRRQIAKALAKIQPDSLLIFWDGVRQIWVWPESQNKHGAEVRLTAQRHFIADQKNQSLEARLKLLDVRRLGSNATSTEILRSLKNAFNADEEAAVAIADLHDALVEQNGAKTELEVFLTRLLFIFFGDDTELFGPNGMVHEHLEGLKEDGSETNRYFDDLIRVLSLPDYEREKDDRFLDVGYVNGGLFKAAGPSPNFNSRSQKALLIASAIEWGALSPAIFGAMFQGVLETLEAHIIDPTADFKASREELGAHYTSEPNILKVIEPLFLEDLKRRFAESSDNIASLHSLKAELTKLTFLDPACGCGNFLVVTYRELRHLEHDIIAQLIELGDTQVDPEDVSSSIQVDIDQFFGIEIVESAAQIAKVALWITDHQMNREADERFGSTRKTIPLRTVPHIARADALSKPWDDVLPGVFCSYVIGNPPFLGSRRNNQKANLLKAVSSLSRETIRGIGDLDLVAGWFALSVRYMKRLGNGGAELDLDFETLAGENVWWKDAIQGLPKRICEERVTRVALVATNSITQGEQVSVLWPELFRHSIEIAFAYRSFKWTNDAPGMAGVHCVIVALQLTEYPPKSEKRIYTAFDQFKKAANISPYLIDGPNLTVESHEKTLWPAPKMSFGNQPIDGGHLMLDDYEIASLDASERELILPYLRDYVGSREMMNGTSRKILWLPSDSKPIWIKIPTVNKHLDSVSKFRLKSPRAETRELAVRPWEWGFTTPLGETYLAIPGVSSEAREYVPIAFYSEEVIASNALLVVPNARLTHFSVLCSAMHNAWIRIVAGRLESRIRCSASITYNPFPWPDSFSDSDAHLADLAKSILEERSKTGLSLGESYTKLDEYPGLRLAHTTNDDYVDRLYGYTGGKSDEERFEFLLNLYANKKHLTI